MAAAFARRALCLLLVLITAVLTGCSPVKTDVLASGSAEESRPAPQEASTVEVPGPPVPSRRPRPARRERTRRTRTSTV